MEIKSLETKYLKAKVSYYDGYPMMSDTAFDVLEQELIELGSKVVEQVGSKRRDFDFPHPTPMKSLAKIQTEKTNKGINYKTKVFSDWFSNRTLKVRDMSTVDHIHYAPKFDGSAINIIYRDGIFESVLTRGDGKFGKDVSDRFVKHLPARIPVSGIVEIRCEAVMSKSIFQKKYANKFANARNIVAGIIGSDDIDEDKIKDITLIPIYYLIDGVHQDIKDTFSITNDYFIFSRSTHSGIIPPTRFTDTIKYWENVRDQFAFQLDGVVFSFPCKFRDKLGENDHDPEWAIAIKFVPDEVVTTVTGIEWNLGKSGELTPVVQLEPVQLAGTTVKRASGYNAGYIMKNAIGVGAKVTVAKAGDIIPELQSVILETPETFILPHQCPECKSKLKLNGIHLICPNEKCTGKVARKLASAAAMLDLKGIAGKTLEPFAKDFNNIYDVMIWTLTKGDTDAIKHYGIKPDSRSHEIFVDAFRNIKSLSYAQVILMMGYDGVGIKLAEQAAKEYCGLEPDYKGHDKSLVRKLQDTYIITYILSAVDVLESLGVHVDKPEDKKDNIETTYICMTGSPKSFGYKTKSEFISQFENVEEVSLTDSRCNYLVTDDMNSTSSKMNTAKKKGIKIVTYKEFKI